MFLAVFGTLSALVLGVPAAYALSRYRRFYPGDSQNYRCSPNHCSGDHCWAWAVALPGDSTFHSLFGALLGSHCASDSLRSTCRNS